MSAMLDQKSHGVPRTPEPPKKDHANKDEQGRKADKPGEVTPPPMPVDVHVKGEQTQAPPSELKPRDGWTSRQI